MQNLIFFAGMVFFSLIVFKLFNNQKHSKSWIKFVGVIIFIIYTALGCLYGYVLPVIAAIVFLFIVYYPLRLIYMITIDLIQRKNYSILSLEDEDFRKLDVDSQLSFLGLKVRYYKKLILQIQTIRSLAYISCIFSLFIIVLGVIALIKTPYDNILLLAANIVLFILLFDIKPRIKGVFYNFFKSYVMTDEMIKQKKEYQQILQQTMSDIKSIEHGYYTATKQQIMNRLRF